MASRSSKTIALGVLPLMATAFLASCGEDETAYCVDGEDTVVDNQYCDDDFNNGGYYWAFIGGGTSYVKGSKVKKAASKIAASNKSALATKGGFGSKSSSGVGRSVASSSKGSSGGS